MGRVNIGRILAAQDPEIEGAIQEVASEVGNVFQFGSSAPGANTPGKVYFKHGTADSNGWATVETVYIKTE